ncbi:hypothetical protein ACFZB9_28440 [Kitasatospora sp. NPDC008050]|uniref:hypothetical protein n=1 Tax=Kitasatospora sp. NPDC008050 TaxID=3364021 RepID=UPI0036E393F4
MPRSPLQRVGFGMLNRMAARNRPGTGQSGEHSGRCPVPVPENATFGRRALPQEVANAQRIHGLYTAAPTRLA